MKRVTSYPNAELFYAYCFGWRDGAGARGMDETRSRLAEEPIKSAYIEGWHDGEAARKKASAKAARKFDYKPQIIRTMKK
jgi:hypothetical protein